MTPKEKAEELLLKFRSNMLRRQAIDCALIVVEEIIKIYPCIDDVDRIEIEYWQEVKQEIENL